MRPLLLALALLAAGLCANPALAQNRFWLVNESGLVVQHAYISPSRLSDWGLDILGGTRLASGEQVRVTPAAKDCVLDLKVEYEGGQEEEKMEVNACRLDRIVFTNPNGRAEGPGGRTGMAGHAGGADQSLTGDAGRPPQRDRGRPGPMAQAGCAAEIRLVSGDGRPGERRRSDGCAGPGAARR